MSVIVKAKIGLADDPRQEKLSVARVYHEE